MRGSFVVQLVEKLRRANFTENFSPARSNGYFPEVFCRSRNEKIGKLLRVFVCMWVVFCVHDNIGSLMKCMAHSSIVVVNHREYLDDAIFDAGFNFDTVLFSPHISS